MIRAKEPREPIMTLARVIQFFFSYSSDEDYHKYSTTSMDQVQLQLLCWLSELEYFAQHGRSMVGDSLEYIKTDTGPRHRYMQQALDYLVQDNAIKITRTVECVEPEYSLYDYEEKGLIKVLNSDMWNLLKNRYQDINGSLFGSIKTLSNAGIVKIKNTDVLETLEKLVKNPCTIVDADLLEVLADVNIIKANVKWDKIRREKRCYNKVEKGEHHGIDYNQGAIDSRYYDTMHRWLEWVLSITPTELINMVKMYNVVGWNETSECQYIDATQSVIDRTRKHYVGDDEKQMRTFFDLIDISDKGVERSRVCGDAPRKIRKSSDKPYRRRPCC